MTTQATANVMVLVDGQPMTELPKDLYIPPQAMEVMLTQFQGPLDLLLYLIRKHRIDVLNIPVSTITEQYLKYIKMMQAMRLTLAGEYLLMAAMLCDIKARMLLPKPPILTVEDEEGVDPRTALVERLQAYEAVKQAADVLEQLPQLGRERTMAKVNIAQLPPLRLQPTVSLQQLLRIYQNMCQRLAKQTPHSVAAEALNVGERITQLRTWVLKHHGPCAFTQFICVDEGRMGVVVTFIALLELVRTWQVRLVQADGMAPLRVVAIAS